MSSPITPGKGALPPTGEPRLLAADFILPPDEESGPEGSTGTRGTAPVDTIDHIGELTFGLYGNDIYNVCTPTAIANNVRLTSGYYTGLEIVPTQAEVFDLYRRGNPDNAGFVPNGVQNGPFDNGCSVQPALDEILHNGMGGGAAGRIAPLAFAAVDYTNDAELRASLQLFGGLVYTFDISTSQVDVWYDIQYLEADEAWSVYTTPDGSHFVVCGAYEPTNRQDVISWGTRIPVTANFRHGYLKEAWVVIWPWTIEHPTFQTGVDYDALSAAYEQLTGRAFPPAPYRPPQTSISQRWKSGTHVGAAKPRAKVLVRRGHYHRRYSADQVWEAVWVADSDWMVIPNIKSITTEQSFDNNGVQVATVVMDNIAYVVADGVAGDYHTIERGWFSPLRAYKAPGRPYLYHKRNDWDRLLTDAVEIHISQGYGDALRPTFSGLVDSSTVGDLPDQITLSCRDFGGNLVDAKLFGWNIDPAKRDPITFYDTGHTNDLLTDKDPDVQKEGAAHQKKGVIVDDASEMVKIVLRWGGFNVDNMHIVPTGATLGKQGFVFDRQSSLMDVIKKACDLTGFIFYIEPASGDHPNGRPIFRQPNAALTNPPILTEIRDDQLVTGVQWATDNTQKASIIRVRGKRPTDKRGWFQLTTALGGDTSLAFTAVYRPPWHKSEYLTGTDRDARVLRHEIHEEPLYDNVYQCRRACLDIALAMALGATTATIEVPGYPGLNLDTCLNLVDRPSGLNTRIWLAHTTTTQTFGQQGTYKASLGVSLLDNPDVVEVVKDMNALVFTP